VWPRRAAARLQSPGTHAPHVQQVPAGAAIQDSPAKDQRGKPGRPRRETIKAMTARILFEGHNLTLASATGIGTYARTLAHTARTIGYETDVLISSNARYDRKDPQFSEIALFDPLTARKPSVAVRVASLSASMFGRPFGMRPSKFQHIGSVVGSSADTLTAFNTIYTAPNVFDVARSHFRRHGRLMSVRVEEKPALFHATHPTPVSIPNCPNIYTIHDLVPLRLPHATLDDKRYTIRLLRHLCRKADHLVTVSNFSKTDIMRLFNLPEERITNTYQSVDLPEALLARPEAEVADEIANAFGVGFREYFLFVGAIEPKKNISRLIDAYAASGSQHPLLIAGGLGWQYERDIEKINDEKFLYYRKDRGRIQPERRVRRLAYLSLPQLVSLIRGARAILFPSLYEGFGLPVLEAMLLGTPVLTSNAASLPEISGDAAILVDPLDTDAISRAIRALDQDADLRGELSLRGTKRAAFFSPKAYRKTVAELYERLGVTPA
jgi:glycosyltransferase involved in cell wall biosynthesis